MIKESITNILHKLKLKIHANKVSLAQLQSQLQICDQIMCSQYQEPISFFLPLVHFSPIYHIL